MSTAENSIRADLEAAVKAQAAPPEVETPDVEAIDTSAEQVETPAQERARDELGRFAAKEAAASARAKPGDAMDGVAAASGADTAVQQSAVQPAAAPNGKPAAEPAASEQAASLAPPNGWSAEAKAVWHEAHPAIQAAAAKREQDVAKFISQRDEHASFGKQMYQMAQPYLPTIKAAGASVEQAIGSALNTMYVLHAGTAEQKRNAVLNVIREHNIDLGQQQQAAQGGVQQPTNTAPVVSVQEQIDAYFQQIEAAKYQTKVEAAASSFKANPKFSRFEEVKDDMSALLRSGAIKSRTDDGSDRSILEIYEEAYDRSVWGRPDTRATLLAQQEAEKEQKRRVEAKQKAEAAKRKNVSITGGPGNTAAQAAPGGRSIAEELRAAMAASDGAV